MEYYNYSSVHGAGVEIFGRFKALKTPLSAKTTILTIITPRTISNTGFLIKSFQFNGVYESDDEDASKIFLVSNISPSSPVGLHLI